MAPDAEDCRQVERHAAEYQPVAVHQGRRVLPEEAAPVHAWLESEEVPASPGEHRRLLGPDPRPLPLTLTPWKQDKCPLSTVSLKPRVKTKFERRKEKLIAALRPPYFVTTIIILMCGVQAAQWAWGGRVRARLEWAPGAWRREPWRLLSYSCTHAGGAHLALNALVALAVGWRLEREQGWARVCAVWWGGVLAGAAGAALWQPRVRVVGASAAVYALLTAHLPNVCLRFGHIPLWWFRPLSVVVLAASEGWWALVRAPAASPAYHHVAWSAHLLGAAVGVPLGFLVFNGENSSKSWVVWGRAASSLLLALGAALALLHMLLHEEYT